MNAKEFRIDQDYSYDHFTELTSTGITYNANNLDTFAEDYHQAKLKLLNLHLVDSQRELLVCDDCGSKNIKDTDYGKQCSDCFKYI